MLSIKKVWSLDTLIKQSMQLKHGSKVLKALNWLLISTDLLMIVLLLIGIQYKSVLMTDRELPYLLSAFVVLVSFFLITAEIVYFLVMVYLMGNSKNILLHFSLLILLILLLFRENLFWNILDF